MRRFLQLWRQFRALLRVVARPIAGSEVPWLPAHQAGLAAFLQSPAGVALMANLRAQLAAANERAVMQGGSKGEARGMRTFYRTLEFYAVAEQLEQEAYQTEAEAEAARARLQHLHP